MPIGTVDFPVLTPEQANPLGYGYEQGARAKANLATALLNHMNALKADPTSEFSIADLIGKRLSNENQKNVNKYYARNIESEIGLRGATTGLSNIQTALHKMELGHPGLLGSSEFKDMAIHAMNAANSTSAPIPAAAGAIPSSNSTVIPNQNMANMTPTPWAQQAAQIALPTPAAVAPTPLAAAIAGNQAQSPKFNEQAAQERLINARNSEAEAKASYWESGGSSGGVPMQLQRKLANDIATANPNFTPEQIVDANNQLLSGRKTLSDGTPINVGGIINQDLVNVQGTKATAAIKNQGVQMELLADNLHNVDINALSSFTGPGGKARLAAAKLKMVSNPDDPSIDPQARNYFTAVNQAIFTMDQLRKAYGTSVVPDYVYNTMGRLANPNDSVWNDKTQVVKTFNATIKQVDDIAKKLYAKSRGGVLAESGEQNNSPASSGSSAGEFDHLSNEELARLANG
jgi:hypothetical protein